MADWSGLNRYLTPNQLAEIRLEGRCWVDSLLPERRYSIPLSSGGMVTVYENGEHTKRLCLQPADAYLSHEDWLLLQVLLLQNQEKRYLKQALSWDARSTTGQPMYQVDEAPRFARLERERRNARRRERRVERRDIVHSTST